VEPESYQVMSKIDNKISAQDWDLMYILIYMFWIEKDKLAKESDKYRLWSRRSSKRWGVTWAVSRRKDYSAMENDAEI
jgi:hypothetical protein